MRDQTPSSPANPHPIDGLSRILSLRKGPGSQTQMQQLAGGNASAAGDQTWVNTRASPVTHFPENLLKPLPEYADLHAETQHIRLD